MSIVKFALVIPSSVHRVQCAAETVYESLLLASTARSRISTPSHLAKWFQHPFPSQHLSNRETP